MAKETHTSHNPDEFKHLDGKPAETPTVEQVRESVQHGVDTILKPFLVRVRRQQNRPIPSEWGISTTSVELAPRPNIIVK